jgi:hypothetical protein
MIPRQAVLLALEELASFENPNEAFDFAEATVRQQRAIGSLVELVDPPHGLIGAS